MTERQKIVVGISGGVDSAVTAFLLQRQGYDVHGVFMKNWSEDDFGGPCPWEEDQGSATAVADHLGIPLETWNFEQEYRDRVFRVMINEYEHGRTPNPDILCNREIKFSLFLERALQSAPMIATGHYARTKGGRLFAAVDRDKDQSYFLAAVPGLALETTLFPLGELTKREVRSIAKDAGLPNWDRPDSVGICFVGERKMFDFLGKYIAPSPGPMQLPDGTVIGEHRGLQFYTIGQRHGFGSQLDQKIVSKTVGAGKALFVAEKRMSDNVLVLAPAENNGVLETKQFFVSDPHWIHGAPELPWRGQAKLRYRQANIGVTLDRIGESWRVTCDAPQRAVTPGQFAVFYAGDECLGSASIDSINP